VQDIKSAQRRKEELKKIHRNKGQEEKRKATQAARTAGRPEPKRRKQRD
jgi:hypothetical protein